MYDTNITSRLIHIVDTFLFLTHDGFIYPTRTYTQFYPGLQHEGERIV